MKTAKGSNFDITKPAKSNVCMNTESTLTTFIVKTRFIPAMYIEAKTELHAFKTFTKLFGNYGNETLTITPTKHTRKLTDLSGFRNIFNP